MKYCMQCIHDNRVMELMRGLRQHASELIEGLSEEQLNAMRLGLGHSLSRYKLKFSPDKVDTMIVQAIGLLDELDKEINIYAMRVKEWYGWHFPEMARILNDNEQYARVVLKMGTRNNAPTTDFSDVLPSDVESSLKEAAIISMGTDISEQDLINIKALAEQVINMMEYRATLFDYLKNRMHAIAPNLTMMVGELVGARLIAHAGSLMNLAKQPASTVQILGAEKALFRALKTKHDTPKYGLIYHASLVGQTQPKNKGKISRVLAAKTALSIRVDALGESSEPTVAVEAREKVEERMRQLEGGYRAQTSGGAKARSRTSNDQEGGAQSAITSSAEAGTGYNTAADVTVAQNGSSTEKKAKKEKKEKKEKKKGTKRQAEESVEAIEEAAGGDDAKKAKKAAKKAKKAKKADA